MSGCNDGLVPLDHKTHCNRSCQSTLASIYGPVFTDTKKKNEHVTRMLRRLRVEDFGPATDVVDARTEHVIEQDKLWVHFDRITSI